MLTFILISFAALFKAVADTVQFHFYISVFNTEHFYDRFWNPDKSWQYAKRIRGYKVDAWHICNSLMIVSFTMAAIFNDLNWQWWIQLPVLGVQYNLIFNLFYNKLLRLPE